MQSTYDLMIDAIRVLFLAGAPMVAVCVLASIIASALQSFFSVQDPVISYALRLMGVILVFTALSVSIIGSFEQLMVQALTP